MRFILQLVLELFQDKVHVLLTTVALALTTMSDKNEFHVDACTRFFLPCILNRPLGQDEHSALLDNEPSGTVLPCLLLGQNAFKVSFSNRLGVNVEETNEFESMELA